MSILTAHPDGSVTFIYSDELRPYLELGNASIRRASHVEPTAGNRWDADMTPSGGPPSLGGFDTRQEALDAEVAWLREHGV